MKKAIRSFKIYVDKKPIKVTFSQRLSELYEKDPLAFGNFQMHIYDICYFVEDEGMTRIYNRETRELEMILERFYTPEEVKERFETPNSIDVWEDFPF